MDENFTDTDTDLGSVSVSVDSKGGLKDDYDTENRRFLLKYYFVE